MTPILRTVIGALLIFAGSCFAADPFVTLQRQSRGAVDVLRVTDPTSCAALQSLQYIGFQDGSLSSAGMTQFYIQKDRYVPQPLLWMLGYGFQWQPPVPFGFPVTLSDGLVAANVAASGITFDTADVRKCLVVLDLTFQPGAAKNWYVLAVDTTGQIQSHRVFPKCPEPMIGYEFGCPQNIPPQTVSMRKEAARASFAHIDAVLPDGRQGWYLADESAGDMAKLLAAIKEAPAQ